MVDGVKGVDRAVLIRTSMVASRRSVKKRQVLSQSLAVHPSILSLPERASVSSPEVVGLKGKGRKTILARGCAYPRGSSPVNVASPLPNLSAPIPKR